MGNRSRLGNSPGTDTTVWQQVKLFQLDVEPFAKVLSKLAFFGCYKLTLLQAVWNNWCALMVISLTKISLEGRGLRFNHPNLVISLTVL